MTRTESTNLDLGRVWENKEHEVKLPVKNLTDDNIIVSEFAASCSCVRIEPKKLEIGPGEEKEITVTLDLTPNRKYEDKTDDWEFDIDVMPTIIQGPRNLAPWHVRGRVRRFLITRPNELSFSEKVYKGGTFSSKTLSIVGLVPIDHITATCDDTLASVQVSTDNKKPNGYNVSLAPRNNMPIGPFLFDVKLKANSASGECLPTIKIKARGRVLNEFQATPSFISSGARPVGEIIEAIVRIHSVKGERLNIFRVETSCDEIHIDSIKSATEGESVFHLRQSILREGEVSDEVKFVVKGNENKEETIVLALTYYGLPTKK